MICPKCSTQNDDEYIFCVNCGVSIPGGAHKTQEYPSVATVVGRAPTATPDTIIAKSVNFELPASGHSTSRKGLIAAIAAAVFVAVGGIAAGAIFLNRPSPPVELLPSHLGMFAVEAEKNVLTEIRKHELLNISSGRHALMKEPSPVVTEKPEFVLYADVAEIPINEMKLIRLDSMTEQGAMRHIDFQAAIIDEKLSMKRLRFPGPLPNGKYAFALFDGYFDEGKHKLWPFEVVGSTAGNVFPASTDIGVALKPKETQSREDKKTPEVTPEQVLDELPPGTQVAYCNATDVTVRSAPNLRSRKVTELTRGQKVYVLQFSDNYDVWNGIRSNWALIETDKGKRGWVFTRFITN
jgi:Bacterial SH3 domain